jgi:hypothetical protein
MLDPTGLRPTGIVLGIIVALFFGAQIVNALIPGRTGGPDAGPDTGPISGPGQPGQTLPPITFPTTPPSGPGATPIPPGSALTAGPLRIPLESGWSANSTNSPSVLVRLTKGSVSIDVVNLTASGGAATPTGIYDGYMGIIGPDATGFQSAPASNITIGPGLPAARGGYTGSFQGNNVEGTITAFVTSDVDGWVWDVWGPIGTVGSLLPEAQRMIDNVQVVTQ